jgi:P-type Mg2+ transporter
MVRGIPADPDAYHPHHPHRQAPFIESRASTALIATSVVISIVGITLPFTAAGGALGFTHLPHLYWPILASMLMAYAGLTHVVKAWFVRRWGM